ncbi:hypothetical protein C1645_733389 [Glomus cerebriforme]|uniref:Uncharacterized protein n=1 Tax=Glomus cerebriforme TaxID=658196 RepID=A0A397TDR7_9GLOM|nr:hypothetical protein C1645_733389 [Glomus cerebriforme]
MRKGIFVEVEEILLYCEKDMLKGLLIAKVEVGTTLLPERYIYGIKTFLEDLVPSHVIKVLLQPMNLIIALLQSYLIENKADWMEQNFDLKDIQLIKNFSNSRENFDFNDSK